MPDEKVADVTEALPAEIAGPSVAAALVAISKLLDEGAGKRPANRRDELFPFTPTSLRAAATLLRKYADVALTKAGPTLLPVTGEPEPVATQPAPPTAPAGADNAVATFATPAAVAEPDEPDVDEDDDWHHEQASKLDMFATPVQFVEPEHLDADEDDEPTHGHAPVVLAPTEPAATGHYAPGTEGYAAEQAQRAAAAGSPNS